MEVHGHNETNHETKTSKMRLVQMVVLPLQRQVEQATWIRLMQKWPPITTSTQPLPAPDASQGMTRTRYNQIKHIVIEIHPTQFYERTRRLLEDTDVSRTRRVQGQPPQKRKGMGA